MLPRLRQDDQAVAGSTELLDAFVTHAEPELDARFGKEKLLVCWTREYPPLNNSKTRETI